MRGLRRTITFVSVLLLIAMFAVPAGAAPQKDKTNGDHASWFELDPIPVTVDGDEVTISGRVSGHFSMRIWSTWFTKQFDASGRFSETIKLVNGQNRIQIRGTNGNGREISGEVVIEASNDTVVDGGGGDPGDPNEPGDPGQPPVTGPALDCGDLIYVGREYTQDGQATTFLIEAGCGSLVADGESLYNLVIVIADSDGHLVPSYHSPITVTTSDATVVEVLNPRTAPVSGIAQVTLRAKAVAPIEITVSTLDLGTMPYVVTPTAP